jgi:hypothetical protein
MMVIFLKIKRDLNRKEDVMNNNYRKRFEELKIKHKLELLKNIMSQYGIFDFKTGESIKSRYICICKKSSFQEYKENSIEFSFSHINKNKESLYKNALSVFFDKLSRFKDQKIDYFFIWDEEVYIQIPSELSSCYLFRNMLDHRQNKGGNIIVYLENDDKYLILSKLEYGYVIDLTRNLPLEL